MKPVVLLFAVLICATAWTVPARAQSNARANQQQQRDLQKAEKRRQKATRKYAKAQKRAERKMLKTERKNSGKYKTYSYRPKAVTPSR